MKGRGRSAAAHAACILCRSSAYHDRRRPREGSQNTSRELASTEATEAAELAQDKAEALWLEEFDRWLA